MPNELVITRRITYRADFNVQLNAAPFIAAGKIITFRLSVFSQNRFKDIFSVILDAAANTVGTRFYSVGAVWRLKIADEDTAAIRQDEGVGTWWLTVEETGDVDEIASGNFQIVNP